ncbi:MAG: hypothetical protein D6797_02690 [Bdellovibrio sp.]|nr:MAG: hypothetical protein D6797_02690 [Bdellovibrio sp.]
MSTSGVGERVKTFFVGHRGTGKTALLRRLQDYFPETPCFDLDQQIEQREKQRISEIFKTYGEKRFREIEKAVLEEISQKHSCFFCSVGAGYRGDFPKDSKVIWVMRPSDKQGRVFLTRPRLKGEKTPLEEYRSLFESRETYYRRVATDFYEMVEGFVFPNEIEKSIFSNHICDLEACVTVSGKDFYSFYEKRKAWGIKFFEFRSCDYSVEDLQKALEVFPKDKVLLSFRGVKEEAQGLFPWVQKEQLFFYWPLEWGKPLGNPSILSLHEGGTDSLDLFSRYESKDIIFKWAPYICSWEELQRGFAWQQEDPMRRSFLPRSSDGRWEWARLYLSSRQSLNFIREGRGSHPDQPSLFSWMAFSKRKSFAAILGDPIFHSLTPAEQFSFFSKRKKAVYRIQLSSEELSQNILNFLREIGLTHAAVTSPLKKKMLKFCDHPSSEVLRFQSLNTLFLKEKVWGHNTDYRGLLEFLKPLLEEEHVIVWGGGGVLNMIKEILPQAFFYSSRKGHLREFSQTGKASFSKIRVLTDLNELSDPSLPVVGSLIWATPYRQFPFCRPQKIFDLNYSENAPGKEMALVVGSQYVSGLSFFKLQAEAQRDFWAQF